MGETKLQEANAFYENLEAEQQLSTRYHCENGVEHVCK